jgi:uncharacterized protein
MFQRTLRWLVMACMLISGLAMAQSEPSLKEVYATAQAGKLDQAQLMMQQVLVAHPESAKAHFVQSELYVRQGNLSRARDSFVKAEKLAPGLPFAKPDAVQALRARLSSNASSGLTANAPVPSAAPAMPSAIAPQQSSSWLMPAALAAAVIALGYFFFRKKAPAQNYGQPAYATGNGNFANGPNGANGANGALATMQPPFGQPQYGAPGYSQPAGNGLGGKIMGGVATGLAVGAGVIAAEAIGRNLMGGHNTNNATSDTNNNWGNNMAPSSNNFDMVGQNFGVNDTSSWEDAASADFNAGGGGDWDN